MEIWSKLDGFTGWYYLPTYDSFYLHVFLKSAVCLLLFCLQFAEPMVKNSKIPKLLLIPLLVWILSLMNFVKKVKKIEVLFFYSLVQLFVYIFGCFSTGKAVFDDFDDHTAKGGLKAMGEAMKRGIK